jgi:hypothetical protein
MNSFRRNCTRDANSMSDKQLCCLVGDSCVSGESLHRHQQSDRDVATLKEYSVFSKYMYKYIHVHDAMHA